MNSGSMEAQAAMPSAQPVCGGKLLPPPATPPPTSPSRPARRSGSTAIHGSSCSSSAFAGKRILIISGGTRGDVQPAVALGVALAGHGACVRLAADTAFEALVTSHGLSFFPLGGDARAMMALTVKWGGMLPTSFGDMLWLRRQIGAVMDSVWAAATQQALPGAAGTAAAAAAGAAGEGYKPDLILANQLAYGQVSVAEKLGVPLHVLLTIPWLPSRHLPHPWARAWDANIADWLTAAAGVLLAPGLALARALSPAAAASVRAALLGRVQAAANWATTPLLDHTAWLGIADLLTSFRRRLGLPLLHKNNTGTALYTLPTTLLFSSAVVPRPPDWGSNACVCGFLSLDDAVQRYAASNSSSSGNDYSSSSSSDDDAAFLLPEPADVCNGAAPQLAAPEARRTSCATAATVTAAPAAAPAAAAVGHGYSPPPALAAFLSPGSGPPPIYVGFGSVCVTAELLQLVIDAADEQLAAGQRLLVATGWSGDGSSDALAAAARATAGGRVLFIRDAPHDWLFARCCVLVHHGGVGTTAAGLRHGKPTLVIPAFGDLFMFGDRCHQLGVGPPPIPLQLLTAPRLSAALRALCADKRDYYAAAAAGLARQLAADGLDAALASVEATLAAATAE